MEMLRDVRIRRVAIQVLLVCGVLSLLLLLMHSTATNLRLRGVPIGFDFLKLPSRFVISESLLRYRPQDTYAWALAVGIANTLFVSVLVSVLSSFLGLIVGVGRLSSNPLVAGTCRIWVEVARNTPPIVLLFFLYSLWWKLLPPVTEAINILPGVFASMRGVFVPWVNLSLNWSAPALFSGAVMLAFVWIHSHFARKIRQLALLGTLGLFVGALWSADPRGSIDWPTFTGTNYRGGLEITPELTTIVVGLTLYTTGFIAEIVRAGILSVGKGQWEAGHALGLRRGRILRLIVFPQMMRIIMPPLTSQYINIIKNSTLSIAVGYPDFLVVVGTVINKSSHAVDGVALILAVYLVINLSLSGLLNWYSRRFALVER